MEEQVIRGKALAQYPIPKGDGMPEVLEVRMTDRGQFARWLINIECRYKGKVKYIVTIIETAGVLIRTQFWHEAFEKITNPEE